MKKKDLINLLKEASKLEKKIQDFIKNHPGFKGKEMELRWFLSQKQFADFLEEIEE